MTVGCDRNPDKTAEVDVEQKILSKGNCFKKTQGSYRTIRIGIPNMNDVSVTFALEIRITKFTSSA
jgi:hypothetical protein